MNTNLADRHRAGAAGGILVAGNPFLGLLPPELRNRPKDAFFLQQNFPAVAALGTSTVVTPVTAEAALLILGGVAQITSSDDQTLVAWYPALVTITDGAQREIMNAGVPLANLFGTGQLPAIWVWPKFIAANATISTTLQSLDSANIRNVRLTYYGFKIY